MCKNVICVIDCRPGSLIYLFPSFQMSIYRFDLNTRYLLSSMSFIKLNIVV